MDQIPATPSLVRIGGVASLIFGGIYIFFAVLSSLGVADTSALSSSPLGSSAVPFFSVSVFLKGVLLVGIGYGLRKRKPWARPLVVLFWVFSGLLAAAGALLAARTGEKFFVSFLWLIGLAGAIWYFYVKGNVVRYYRSLPQGAGDGRSA